MEISWKIDLIDISLIFPSFLDISIKYSIYLIDFNLLTNDPLPKKPRRDMPWHKNSLLQSLTSGAAGGPGKLKAGW
jgi:hypothetical protein